MNVLQAHHGNVPEKKDETEEDQTGENQKSEKNPLFRSKIQDEPSLTDVQCGLFLISDCRSQIADLKSQIFNLKSKINQRFLNFRLQILDCRINMYMLQSEIFNLTSEIN